MKRRSFPSLSAHSVVPVAARAADDTPYWDDTVNSDGLACKAVDDEEKIKLQVELIRPAERKAGVSSAEKVL